MGHCIKFVPELPKKKVMVEEPTTQNKDNEGEENMIMMKRINCRTLKMTEPRTCKVLERRKIPGIRLMVARGLVANNREYVTKEE